ncbi:MAG: type III secretion system outer membrane ring subunit SctC [Desulfovibrio sp.]|jgi:type III secretion protein C|nr:type III secretion system outer membrane ring subunit SctC [Desulfovibrio sp.]
MNSTGRKKYILGIPLLFLLLSFCLPAATAAAAGLADLRRPYTHTSQGEPLASLLSDFAISQGYSASFTPGVTGVVNGDFSAMPPARFLAGIRAGYGVEAYTLGSTIYFFNQSERRREVLRVNSMPPGEMRDALMRMGVLSPDLPSNVSRRERLLFIEGPDNYVTGLVASIRTMEEAQLNDQVIKVFRLKYAWADDTTIENASNSVLLPGVASVLRSIATGQPSPAVRTLHRSDSGSSLMGTGLGSRSTAGSGPTDAAPAEAAGSGPNIIAEPRSNSVIVTDKQHKMPYYEAVIAELDKAVDLVEIHAAILDVNADYAYNLGINWGGQRTGGSFGGSELLIGAPGAGVGAAADAGFAMTTVYTSGLDRFFSNIRALEAIGESNILARPSVLTVDNVQASLEHTTTFYIKLEGYQATDLVPVTSGTILKVTPRILRMPDGRPSRLSMTIVISDGADPVASNKDTWVGNVPPVTKVTINTQAVVGEGQSLLLGGFYYENRRENETGVPGLMNVPLLGSLFSRKEQSVRRMERMILISPRIISYNALDVPVPDRVNEHGFALNPTTPDYALNEDFYAVEPRSSGCTTGSGIRPAPNPVPQPGNAPPVPQPGGAPVLQPMGTPVRVPQPGAPPVLQPGGTRGRVPLPGNASER